MAVKLSRYWRLGIESASDYISQKTCDYSSKLTEKNQETKTYK